MLSALLLLEILADCIPALASCSDSLMLLIKPLLSVALALSPSYGILGVKFGVYSLPQLRLVLVGFVLLPVTVLNKAFTDHQHPLLLAIG